ncbi:hypothetical protein NLJ89_g5224 [Agrocybe chaxingu]|uniref:F-box domain-containing protein n=1 Tax=Agrocybe chaxingu TaxID=84603 RepID=A0A9W8K175_9AGAR|nr:hypothetical protein NLJ89_g5224 [Agrocybe chaxingu]
MTTIHDIPPEILAASFEVGIYAWGIGYLRPLSHVCQTWRDTIEHTPRLWGIITFTRSRSAAALLQQLAKAKNAPLALTIEPQSITRSAGKANVRKDKEEALKTLLERVGGWISVDVGTDLLAKCRWEDMGNLEKLVIRPSGSQNQAPGPFFASEFEWKSLKLHSFSTTGGVPNTWVTPFLKHCPSIRYFSLHTGNKSHTSQTSWHSKLHDIRDTWAYLVLVPNAYTIELTEVAHTTPTHISPPPPILLRHLRNLRLREVRYAPAVLTTLIAPSLQTLTLEHTRRERQAWSWLYTNSDIAADADHRRHKLLLAPFFTQWSAPGAAPEHLHTLELKECLRSGDIPYLVRWLDRLPHLVRLVIQDDQVGAARKGDDADPDANLYLALSAPRTMTSQKNAGGNPLVGWLCPELMILHLDTDHELADVISIASTRGGKVVQSGDSERHIPPPARLRRIETRLCPMAEPKDLRLLRSLVDHISCVCTNCGLMLEPPSPGSIDIFLFYNGES